MENLTDYINLMKRFRKLPNCQDKFPFVDECLTSYEEVRAELSQKLSELMSIDDDSDGLDGLDGLDVTLTLGVKEEYISKASMFLWNYNEEGVILKGQVELFAYMVHDVFWIGMAYSKLMDNIRLYEEEVTKLRILLKSKPAGIHCRSDNRNGYSCTITSGRLMDELLIGLKRQDVHEKVRITRVLGQFVVKYENTAKLIIHEKDTKGAIYEFIGNVVYMFLDSAPNPKKWEDLKRKEKFDIVKGWVKQYDVHNLI